MLSFGVAEPWNWSQEQGSVMNFSIAMVELSADSYTVTWTLFDNHPDIPEREAVLALKRINLKVPSTSLSEFATSTNILAVEALSCNFVATKVSPLKQSLGGIASATLECSMMGHKYGVLLKIFSSEYIATAS